MREMTDEEVLSTELHITVEQYLRGVERIVGDLVMAYLDKYEPSDELEIAKKRFKTLFLVIRRVYFDGFKTAIIKGAANHDGKIN